MCEERSERFVFGFLVLFFPRTGVWHLLFSSEQIIHLCQRTEGWCHIGLTFRCPQGLGMTRSRDHEGRSVSLAIAPDFPCPPANQAKRPFPLSSGEVPGCPTNLPIAKFFVDPGSVVFLLPGFPTFYRRCSALLPCLLRKFLRRAPRLFSSGLLLPFLSLLPPTRLR